MLRAGRSGLRPRGSEVLRPRSSELLRAGRSDLLRSHGPDLLRNEQLLRSGPAAVPSVPQQVLRSGRSDLLRPCGSDVLRSGRSDLLRSLIGTRSASEWARCWEAWRNVDRMPVIPQGVSARLVADGCTP